MGETRIAPDDQSACDRAGDQFASSVCTGPSENDGFGRGMIVPGSACRVVFSARSR